MHPSTPSSSLCTYGCGLEHITLLPKRSAACFDSAEASVILAKVALWRIRHCWRMEPDVGMEG
jgi:hypothetical protein